MGVGRRLVLAAPDQRLGSLRCDHRVARRAGELLALEAAHDEVRRHEVAAFGDFRPDLPHLLAAIRAAALFFGDRADDPFARQVLREGRATVTLGLAPTLLGVLDARSGFRRRFVETLCFSRIIFRAVRSPWPPASGSCDDRELL